MRSYCYSIVINNNNNNKKVIVIDNNNKKSYCYLITITFLLFVINNKKITNNFFFWKILVLLYNYVETYQFYLFMVLRLLGDDTDHNFNYIAYETLKTPKWSFRVFVSHTTEIHWFLYKGRFLNARSSLMWYLVIYKSLWDESLGAIFLTYGRFIILLDMYSSHRGLRGQNITPKTVEQWAIVPYKEINKFQSYMRQILQMIIFGIFGVS